MKVELRFCIKFQCRRQINAETFWLRLFGGIVCSVSFCTFCLGIADVIVARETCKDADKCDTFTSDLFLTWIGVGIWASIPIFINGVNAIWISTHSDTTSRIGILILLSIMSSILFAPALIVISALEVYYTFPQGLPPAPAVDKPRLCIPFAVGVGGAILLANVLALFIYACRRIYCTDKHRANEFDCRVQDVERANTMPPRDNRRRPQQQRHRRVDSLERYRDRNYSTYSLMISRHASLLNLTALNRYDGCNYFSMPDARMKRRCSVGDVNHLPGSNGDSTFQLPRPVVIAQKPRDVRRPRNQFW